MERKLGRPVGTTTLENPREVKFLVNRDDWAALQAFARSKQKTDSAVMRDLVRLIVA
jgi:hypothetical protein